MARKKRSPAELREAANHLLYEVQMLQAVANGLASGLFGSGTITNALVESFAVHVRGLADFLYSDHPRPDDVIAGDFFSDAARWLNVRPDMSAVLSLAKQRAGKEITHLTYARLAVTPETKPWPFVQIVNDMAPVLSLFFQNLPPDLLDSGQVTPGSAPNDDAGGCSPTR